MALAEGVAADDERDGLLVVHHHARERLADVLGHGERIGVAVGALGVHVDQAHLHRAEQAGELAVTAVPLVAEPRVLGTPEHLFGLPGVLASAAEAERRESHQLSAQLPAKIIRSPHEILSYFCFTGQSSRRALSRLALSGQLFSGAKRSRRCRPPRPSAMR